MSNTSNTYWTAAEIANRWNVHRATVPRVMAGFCFARLKFGCSKQSSRRYAYKDVLAVKRGGGPAMILTQTRAPHRLWSVKRFTVFQSPSRSRRPPETHPRRPGATHTNWTTTQTPAHENRNL